MVSAYGPNTPLISQFVPKNMLNAAQILSKLGTTFEAKTTVETVSEGNPKTPVMFDIFSGTGSVGQFFSDDLHWKVYSINICKKSAKRSRGVCADVLNFDFLSWPQPDFIWLSPPCTPWSNATPLTKRRTPEYIKMAKLCEVAINW